VLLERYSSHEALAEHRRTPHFTDLLLGRIVPLLSARVVEEYDVPA
jgi:quinol monooxygenase YgiN